MTTTTTTTTAIRTAISIESIGSIDSIGSSARAARIVASVTAMLGVLAAVGCGSESVREPIDEPLAPIEAPENRTRDLTGEAATASGAARIDLVAVDSASAMAYIIALEIEEIGALPLDEPVEAGPALAVRFVELANGAIPVENAALCERLNDPSPACDDTVSFLPVTPARAHSGVLTLWTNEDVVTGVIDVELSDTTNAVGTFSLDI